MTKSTITVKNQTTVPREVRERLGVGPSDQLVWEVVGDQVRVTAASHAFLRREGSITHGPSDAVEAVRLARKLMGIKSL
ncbi:MAG TPA: AbrB/MazE/SpoVT family DNA-binding domain-containing protein [Thermoanaerobaculia bacterium]|jgi:bifunctional DNA-binding transcriptional regulator/antitoxin component of YhaV-PrlF toxin-antitoxin module|nr:AbrB/MazE/SpoVT family DNA-binding domain-containing protein [Thermoanaerobaculia bacterium]